MFKKFMSMTTAILVSVGALTFASAPTASAAVCGYAALNSSMSIKSVTVTSTGTGAANIGALVANPSLHGSISMDTAQASRGAPSMISGDFSHNTDVLTWKRFTSVQDPTTWDGTGTENFSAVQFANGDKIVVKVTPAACDVVYFWIDFTVAAASSDASITSGMVKSVNVTNFGTPNSSIGSVVAGAVSILPSAATNAARATDFTMTAPSGALKVMKKFAAGTTPDASAFQAAQTYSTGNITDGDIIIVQTTAADTTTKLYYKIVVTVSSSTPSSNSSASDAVAAAIAAAEKVAAAKVTLVDNLKSGKPITANDLNSADITVASAAAADRVNAKIQALPAAQRSDLAAIKAIVQKENFVEKVSSSATQVTVNSLDLIRVGLIAADYKNKTEVLRTLIAKDPATLTSMEKVEAAVKAAQATIQARKDRLAATIAKIRATK